MLGFGLLFPLLPLYAKSFGVGYDDVGLVGASFAFTRLLFDLVAGGLVPRFGERATAAWGSIVVGLSTVLSAPAPPGGRPPRLVARAGRPVLDLRTLVLRRGLAVPPAPARPGGGAGHGGTARWVPPDPLGPVVRDGARREPRLRGDPLRGLLDADPAVRARRGRGLGARRVHRAIARLAHRAARDVPGRRALRPVRAQGDPGPRLRRRCGDDRPFRKRDRRLGLHARQRRPRPAHRIGWRASGGDALGPRAGGRGRGGRPGPPRSPG